MRKLKFLIAVFLLAFPLLVSCGKGPEVQEHVQTEMNEKNEETKENELIEVFADEEVYGADPENAENAESVGSEEAVFFGRKMAANIAEINQKTLASQGAMLFDVLNPEASFTGAQILEMISGYNLPERAYYGEEPASEEIKQTLLAYRNIEALNDGQAALSYGILIDNADVRAFPTLLTAKDSLEPEAFDYFQESMFSIGSGVIILHTTSDGVWSFVQGDNYFGWVETGKIGVCDRETFVENLSAEDFVVSVGPNIYVKDTKIRIGTVLSLSENGNLLFPEKGEDGSLYFEELPVDQNQFHVGFLPFSSELAIQKMTEMIDTPYGWGDTAQNYDCSSTVGLVYRMFGLYTPRNTSAIPNFAGGDPQYVQDISELGAPEKLAEIAMHPGCILIMPGHAMLYAGEAEGIPNTVIHNNSSFNTIEGEKLVNYGTVRSNLENMYGADEIAYICKVTTIIFVK